MILKGIFVDDQDKQYAALLSTTGILKFSNYDVGPVLPLANAILEARPAILALDYRLDENADDLAPNETFKAGVLGQQLRDRAIVEPEIDLPIVLVSNESKIEALYRPDKTAHDLFDRVYRKEAVNGGLRPHIRAELVALAQGYVRLREASGEYDPAALLARPDAPDLFRQQDVASAFDQASAPHTLTRFVLKALIDQPGLLVDDADAAARLGLDSASFERLAEREDFQAVRYRGLFSGGWRRWWLDALLAWSEALLDARPISLTNAARAERLADRIGLPLEPAMSPWTGKTDEAAALACAVCRRPIEVRHAVAAYAPTPWRFVIPPRICWDCIQHDRQLDRQIPIMVDDSDRELAESVKNRQREA